MSKSVNHRDKGTRLSKGKAVNPKDSTKHDLQNPDAQHPLENIIDKFHKMKEGRFKPKERQRFPISNLNPSNQNVKIEIGKSMTGKVSYTEDAHAGRPLSAHMDKEQVSRNQRRMSLPSLFHPITPFPTKSESAESIEKLAHDVEDILAHDGRRRHSVAHVIGEYSRHDLEHLAKIHEMKLQELNEAKSERGKPKEEEKKENDEVKEKPRWLNGDDLHAFYNMWDNKHSSGQKRPRIKKKLPMPNEDDDEDTEYVRPRVFSF